MVERRLRAEWPRWPREVGDVPRLPDSATGAAMVTGTPDGACAPVMRVNSASPEWTWAVSGVIPAVVINRAISRR